MKTTSNTLEIETLLSSYDIIEYANKDGIINLAGNHSEIDCASELEENLKEYILPYANTKNPKFGLKELRATLSHKTRKLYDYEYNPDSEITITSGVKQSVFSTILALVKEGDEVLMFEPAHQSYQAAIETVGARAVFISLKAPSFEIDWSDVQKLVRPNTKMIIINTPHYPTGSIISELDMLRLQKVINGTNIIILSDESFEHILFDGEMHQSVSMYPKLQKQSVIISSFNESLLIPNWNVSYCLAPEKHMKSIRKILASMSDGVSMPHQMAISKYLEVNKNYNALAKIYSAKRNLFIKGIEDTNIGIVPSKGSYFQLINIENITTMNDVDFAKYLLENHNLALMPASFYYHQKAKSKYLRLNLSVADDQIMKAVNILCTL